MSSTIVVDEAAITREEIRNFHITGRGLECAIPAAALQPAVVKQAFPPARPTADLPGVYAAALKSTRTKARQDLLERVRQSRDRLAELLAIDDARSPEASTADVVEAALGIEGSRFLNPGALAGVLQTPLSASERMAPDRRERIENSIATLDEVLAAARQEPPYYMFSAGQNEQCADAFTTALDFCERELERLTAVLRALRVARLESESSFDPFHHQPLLDRFDWQSADAPELAALPPIVVLESVERLAQMSLTSFGRLLRSGHPIHVVITSCGLFTGDLSGIVPDFGYLSIAHREAFVLQSSLVRPEHLAAGLDAMARTLRPAVAVICVPPARLDEEQARIETSLLHVSRSFPLYSYDPSRGDAWAQRFQLLIEDDIGASLADAAALAPEYRGHFRTVPEPSWTDEMLEMGEYLKQYSDRPPLAIPYIRLEGGRRAIVTRELANLSRDRVRAWRIFEELAGVDKAAVAQHDENVKIDAAREAVRRVAAMLTGARALADARASETTPAPPPIIAETEPKHDREGAVDAPADPYIDSFLCTSCNDCFKINNRLFAYDANKQAYIADARAGTYAQLVKAAAGCPASCIHPGTPRPDDKTATPQILATAARFR